MLARPEILRVELHNIKLTLHIVMQHMFMCCMMIVFRVVWQLRVI